MHEYRPTAKQGFIENRILEEEPHAERWNKVLIFAGFDHEPNHYEPEDRAGHKDGEPSNRHSPQETGADDQGCEHRTNCNVAIARPKHLAPLKLLLARLRCPCFRLLAICNIGPEPDNFLGLAVGFPQQARLVLYPKVVAVLASKSVLLHQLAVAHQERCLLNGGRLVIGMQTVDPPVRGQRFLDFVTKDSFDAVTYPLGGKTFRCDRKLINDGWNGIQNMARPFV